MSRTTEIYCFDKEIASTVFYNDLISKKFYTKTFEDFINERKKEIGNSYNVSYQRILNIVQEDINAITADELFELIYYLNQELVYGKYYAQYKENSNIQHTKYSKYGITLLYEIPGTTTCYAYMFQYGNYTNQYHIKEVKIDEDEQGQNIATEDFLIFNDYVILLMNRILSGGINEYYKDSKNYINEFEKKILKEVTIKYHNEEAFLKMIDDEFNYINSCIQDREKANAPITNTVYSADSILSISLEMKQKINPEKNTRIVIVDSW